MNGAEDRVGAQNSTNAFEVPPWETETWHQAEPTVWPEPTDLDEPDEPEGIIALLAQDSERAVALFRDPDAIRSLTTDLSAALVERVRDLYAAQRRERPGEPGRKPRDADVAAELAMLADAHDTLRAISRAVQSGADEAKGIVGEVIGDVEPDERRTHSIRVGDGHGQDLKAARQQPTEPVANLDDVIDVLVAARIADYNPTSKATAKAYADGLRDGITALLPVLTAPKVKTTMLDAMKRRLEDAGEFDLAIRLGHAYGRASKGEPRITIERIAAKEEATDG